MDNAANCVLTPLTQTSPTAIVHRVSILDLKGNPLLLCNDCHSVYCFPLSHPSALSISVQPALEPGRKSHDRADVLAHMTDQSYKSTKARAAPLYLGIQRSTAQAKATVSRLTSPWRENLNMFLPVYT